MRRPRIIRSLTCDASGAVAVEFAFIMPVLLALFFGGYSIAQGVAISRKVTITTRALADLTTQYATVSADQLATILSASAQIVAPFDPTPLSLRLSEITVDSTGTKATVAWSTSQTMSAYTTGAPFTLPSAMLKANTSYIYSEAQYIYTPLASIGIGSYTINDHIYMLPRLSSSVAYSG